MEWKHETEHENENDGRMLWWVYKRRRKKVGVLVEYAKSFFDFRFFLGFLIFGPKQKLSYIYTYIHHRFFLHLSIYLMIIKAFFSSSSSVKKTTFNKLICSFFVCCGEFALWRRKFGSHIDYRRIIRTVELLAIHNLPRKVRIIIIIK